MAGNGYITNGYTTYNNTEPLYQGYALNDQVRRPNLEYEGRSSPIISYTRPSYVPRREQSYIDHVHTPDYKFNNYEYVPNPESTYVDRVHAPEYTFNNYEGRQEYDYPTKSTSDTHLKKTKTPPPTYTWTKPKKSQASTTTTTGLAADFIGRAVIEAAPPSIQPLVRQVETYVVETIDNREVGRRYARPVFKQQAQETYSGY